MIEVAPNLWVGSAADYEASVRGRDGWATVQACKDPYHRRELGYTGQAAPKAHPEYLVARRPGRLILNLVDAAESRYIPAECVDAALQYMRQQIGTKRTMVHCNQGMSRSPTLALLYLAPQMPHDFADAEEAFRDIYPPYSPAQGIRGYARENWARYR